LSVGDALVGIDEDSGHGRGEPCGGDRLVVFVAAQLVKADLGPRDGAQCLDEVCVAPGEAAADW
jgi:hypothetical protein